MDQLLFLGTGAADWKMEHKLTHADFRRCCAALVNDDLLIDCGPHILDFSESCGEIGLYDHVTDILITHGHSDHFRAETVLQLAEKQKIRLYCDRFTRDKVGAHENITFVSLSPYKRRRVGRYLVTPLLANHDEVITRTKKAYHYIIRTPEGKEIFYGLDGAWFLRPSWKEMLCHTYDLMIFDCTVGDSDDWRLFEHNTIPMLRKMTAEIKEKNLLREGGKLVASHMARTLHGSHEDTARVLKEMDMMAAYDGLRLAIGQDAGNT